MPAAYSYDLRARVVNAVEEGASRRRAAGVFKVSAATVVRWTKRLAETGSCAASPTGGDHKSKAVEAHKDWLLAVVATEPDLTLAEIQTRLKDTHGLTKSTSCLWRFFARHNVTFKKRMARPVRKCFPRSNLSSLRQRIRPVGTVLAKMEIRAFRSS
jgi:transposase